MMNRQTDSITTAVSLKQVQRRGCICSNMKCISWPPECVEARNCRKILT